MYQRNSVLSFLELITIYCNNIKYTLLVCEILLRFIQFLIARHLHD